MAKLVKVNGKMMHPKMAAALEQKKLAALIGTTLEDIFGFEVWDDSAEQTAERWLRAMHEFSPEQDIEFKFTTFDAKVNQMIYCGRIEFSSLCAHHLFPFYGHVHIAYIPNKLQVGLSKMPRLVKHFANRPQTQETMTAQIASYLKSNLAAQGVAVVVEGYHTCMSARGVREHNGVMVTSEMRGTFLTASEARQEFLAIMGREDRK
jgi:GTP cyclohydrolase IA